MVKYVASIQVKQQDGTPASFAQLTVFRVTRICVLWWCWDVENYYESIRTDFYGKQTLSLEEGKWHIRANWRGKQGDWTGEVRSNMGLTIYLRP
jgi:hypothetical protein